MTDDWQDRVDRLWSSFDPDEGQPFVGAMAALAAERPGDPVALFELAGAHDATNSTTTAIDLYREALDTGLPQPLARQAVIQLASSLRISGSPAEAVTLIEQELADRSDDLDDPARAFLALALHDTGRDADAVALLVETLAPHLTRYRTSLVGYARELRSRHPGA